jgi:phage shock protein A
MSTWKHIFHKSNEYAKTAVEMKIDANADPRVQLEQAVAAAQEQNETLRAQGAVVIGHQRQEEARLHRMMDQLETAKGAAAQALQLADGTDDPTQKQQFMDEANARAGEIVSLQTQIEHQHEVLDHATQAAQEAHEAVREHAEDLQAQLQQRRELVSELDQTQMEETLHKTMEALHSTANADIPSMDQVREKIEARKAKQQGYAEIEADSPEHAHRQVQKAMMASQAKGVLDQIRAEALPAGPQPQALGTGK